MEAALRSQAAARRVASLIRKELGEQLMDVAGSGHLSVPVLCFRNLSVVLNALKAGCRGLAPHLEARVDGRRPLSRRVLAPPARRPVTDRSALRFPEAEIQGHVICPTGEVRGVRGTGLWPCLSDVPEARHSWFLGCRWSMELG